MTTQAPGHRPAWVDDELFPFTSKFIQIDGHTIHYVDEGQGYRRLIISLRQRFRCVAFDYPGMGLSSADPAFGYGAAPEVANIVTDWMDANS